MFRNVLMCICVLLLTSSLGAASASKQKGLELRVHRIDPSGVIDVTLSPSDGTSARVWKSSNSWGAANWRVFAARNGDLFSFREDPDQTFSRNVPAFEEVQGKKTISLNIKGEDWIGPTSGFGAFQEGDIVIVVYDVPATTEARRAGVWYGTVSTLAPMVRTN
jgi:hypothetical protein